jgi:hypothetical protein
MTNPIRSSRGRSTLGAAAHTLSQLARNAAVQITAPYRERARYRGRRPSPSSRQQDFEPPILERAGRSAPAARRQDGSRRPKQKAPVGGDRGFCGLTACRSGRPIRIVGGQNDADHRMRRFYRNCNSESAKLTTNCVKSTIEPAVRQCAAPPPVTPRRGSPHLRHGIQRSRSLNQFL